MAKFVRRVLSNPSDGLEDLLFREVDLDQVPDDAELSYRKTADLLGISVPEVRGLVDGEYLKGRRSIDGDKPIVKGKDLAKFLERNTEPVEFVAEDDETEKEEEIKPAKAAKKESKAAKSAETEVEESEEATISLTLGTLVKFVRSILKGEDEEEEAEEEETEAAPKTEKANPSYRTLKKTGKR